MEVPYGVVVIKGGKGVNRQGGWVISPLPLAKEDTGAVPYALLERCTDGWSSQRLGEGGFGCVFLGTHPSNSRLAIKRRLTSFENPNNLLFALDRP